MEKKRYRPILPKPLVKETTPTKQINHLNQAAQSKSSPNAQMGEANIPGVFHILFETNPRKISGQKIKGRAHSTIDLTTDTDGKKLPLEYETDEAEENKQEQDQVMVELDSNGIDRSTSLTNFGISTNKKDHPNRIYGQIKSFECEHCKRRFHFSHKLEQHMTLKHTISFIYCLSCHQVRLKVKNINRGLANQEESKCDECSKQCDVCGKSFANITTLKKHLSIHDGKQESAHIN